MWEGGYIHQCLADLINLSMFFSTRNGRIKFTISLGVDLRVLVSISGALLLLGGPAYSISSAISMLYLNCMPKVKRFFEIFFMPGAF